MTCQITCHPGLLGAQMQSEVGAPGLWDIQSSIEIACVLTQPFTLSLDTVEGCAAASQDHSL